MSLFHSITQAKQHKLVANLLLVLYADFPSAHELHWTTLASRLESARISGHIVRGWMDGADEQLLWIETTHFIIDMHHAPNVEASIISLKTPEAERYVSDAVIEEWRGV